MIFNRSDDRTDIHFIFFVEPASVERDENKREWAKRGEKRHKNESGP